MKAKLGPLDEENQIRTGRVFSNKRRLRRQLPTRISRIDEKSGETAKKAVIL